MTITAIARNFNGNPNIVTMVTTDNLATITTTGYLTTPSVVADIEALQNGEFQWEDTDLVLMSYSPDLIGFFVRDAVNETFDALSPTSGLANTLQDGDIFVGNAGNVATGVTPSGDITLSNAGVFGIASGAIVNADVNAAAAIAFSKLAALNSTQLLVGSAGNVATARTITGDVTIGNTGVTAITANSIINTDVNSAAAIDFSKLATLASTNILVGSAGGVATSVAMTGDVTIGNTGVTAIGANKVLSSMLGVNTLQYQQVAVTAAEFNGMYAAPKLLLANPGANKMIVVDKIDLLMTYVSANYANGGVVAAQYDSTAHGAGVLATTTLSAATFQAAVSTGFMFNTGVVPQTFSTCVNKGLYLSNISGAFDTGDSTFIAHVWYKIIATV